VMKGTDQAAPLFTGPTVTAPICVLNESSLAWIELTQAAASRKTRDATIRLAQNLL